MTLKLFPLNKPIRTISSYLHFARDIQSITPPMPIKNLQEQPFENIDDHTKDSVLIKNILGIVRTLQFQEGLRIKHLILTLIGVLLLELRVVIVLSFTGVVLKMGGFGKSLSILVVPLEDVGDGGEADIIFLD
jgi:hypothetical protein